MADIKDIDTSRKLVLSEIGEKLEDKKPSVDSGLLDEAINKKAKKIGDKLPVKTASSKEKTDYEEAKQAVKKEIGEDKAPVGNDLLDSAISRKAMQLGNITAKPAEKKVIPAESKKVIEDLFIEKKAKQPDKKPIAPKAEKSALTIQAKKKKITPKPEIKPEMSISRTQKNAEAKAAKKTKTAASNAPDAEKENSAAYYVILILAAIIFYFAFFFFQLSQFAPAG